MNLKTTIISALTGLTLLTSLSPAPKQPDPLTVPVCVDHSESLTQYEQNLAIQGFNIAQRKALEQDVILEPTQPDTTQETNNCQTLLYQDIADYMEVDTYIPRTPEEPGFYSLEKQIIRQENSGVNPYILNSLGRAYRDTAKVSIPQTVLSADFMLQHEDIQEEKRKHYVANVTLHEIGHSLGLLHPRDIPNLSDTDKELLSVYNQDIPNFMGRANPVTTESGVVDNGSYHINNVQKQIMRYSLDKDHALYHLLRADRDLRLVQAWYKNNVDSTASQQYIGIRENTEQLPSSLDAIIEQDYTIE